MTDKEREIEEAYKELFALWDANAEDNEELDRELDEADID